MWAALDCPGCFSFELTEGCAILLGQIHVSLQGRVDAGEPCLVAGWEIGATAGEVSPAAFLSLALYLAAGVWLLARFTATVHGFRNEWAVVGVILGVSVLLSSLLMALAGG